MSPPSPRPGAIPAEAEPRLLPGDAGPAPLRPGQAPVPVEGLAPALAEAARARFLADVFPVLTPLAVGPGHPSPRLPGDTLGVAFLLAPKTAPGPKPPRRRADRAGALALVVLPAALPRLARISADGGPVAYVLLEALVAAFAGELFPGAAAREASAFRVTRSPVRLELPAGAPDALAGALARALKLAPAAVLRVPGPLRPAELAPLARREPRPAPTDGPARSDAA